jgi:hypothetical protein
MGGFGSGSYPRTGGAPKCEHQRCVDLANLRRWGFLRPGTLRVIMFGKEKPDRLVVRANADGAGLDFIKRRPDGELGKLFVPFTYTPTPFNGWRAWFRCPGCGKGCRVLYGVNSLCCRKCLGLVYASQSERAGWRALRRAEAIRQRMGGTAYGVHAVFPPKPPRMRWRTYEALRRKDKELLSRYLGTLGSYIK